MRGVSRVQIPAVLLSRTRVEVMLWRCMRLPQRLRRSGPWLRPSTTRSIACQVRGLQTTPRVDPRLDMLDGVEHAPVQELASRLLWYRSTFPKNRAAHLGRHQ